MKTVPSRMLLITIIVFSLAGCSGPNSNARNVQTGATINSIAGTPGAGVVGLSAQLITLGSNIFSRVGKPKIGQTTSTLWEIVSTSPYPVFEDDYSAVFKWKPTRYKKDGQFVLATLENTPQAKVDMKLTYTLAMHRFKTGDFGDGTEPVIKQKLEAWEKGALVVAEYSGPNGAKVVIVSDKNEPGELMTGEEWAARSKN